MERATCMAMDATAGRHGAVFSYKVLKGRVGKSYGLKAAALAGLPQAVLDRAAELVATYENPGQDQAISCRGKASLGSEEGGCGKV